MHIVDRRLNPNSKSLENRQRFLRRAKAQVQEAVRNASGGRDLGDALEGGEVSIPSDGVREPRFRTAPGDVQDHILPGNKTFNEGDVLPRPGGGGGRGGAGEGDGEDAFTFMLTREEFLELFLDDLELPDMAKRRLATTEREGLRRAGYQTTGSPTSMSVTRTMQLALVRRTALRRPSPRALAELEQELEKAQDRERRAALKAEIEAMTTRMRRIPYIDPIDVRYRRFEIEPKPVARAVMFCLMDVSGSMTEHMKDLAKRFYLLLYVFLTRRYKRVEVVFIRHTDRAEEVDEETFFRSPASGGTLVSSALAAMAKIVAERYSPDDWNIYAAQASDGDNAHGDGQLTAQLLTAEVLPVTQYFAYLEVGASSHLRQPMPDSPLWTLYERLQSEGAPLSMRRVEDRNEIYPVFRELFRKRDGQQVSS
ncbi:YeaH/YhbH family protein [Phenylobacterium sp. LjRoot219]|uniref:YeaH/YhbH family protein n=1 Tax=Phenylobacterium sp. LjRoot219 TaxID=3342283 RepID=UPI003ECF4694